jgi:hypothetical protein
MLGLPGDLRSGLEVRTKPKWAITRTANSWNDKAEWLDTVNVAHGGTIDLNLWTSPTP